MGTVPKRSQGGGPNTHEGGTPGRDRLGSLSVVSLYGTGVTSVTAWPPVSQVSLSLHGPWGVAQCHCHCTDPGASHSVTTAAQSHSCDTVLLRSPAVLQSVTVAPWGVTWCHCHRAVHGVSLSLRGCGVPRTVTAAPMGCHTESPSMPGAWDVTQCYVTAWPMGCHPVSPSLHGLGCHTPSLRRMLPSATPCTSRGLSPSVTAHPPQLCHSPSPPAVGHPGDSTAGPSSPSPWGDATLGPSPPPPLSWILLPAEQPFPIAHQPVPSTGL